MAMPQRYLEQDSYTEDEYFAFESTAFGRWEFVHGEIRAMSGGADDHNAISMNIGATLRAALLPKGCRVYGSDMKVHTGDGINTFPDVSVVCGPRIYHRGRTDIITNPILIVEVLSDSTEGYDRSEKFDHYRTIPSLDDYMLVEQTKASVLHYTRDNDHWEFREIVGLDNAVYLPSIEMNLALADIYAFIELAYSSLGTQQLR